jgi:hypothetical protein
MKNTLRIIVFALFICATSTLSAQYKGAIGLRGGYYGNIGLDGKLFINEKTAIEVIATTRRYGVSSIFSYRNNEIYLSYFLGLVAQFAYWFCTGFRHFACFHQ